MRTSPAGKVAEGGPTPAAELTYTLNQLKAIRTIDQNFQIVACAGAGKTQR